MMRRIVWISVLIMLAAAALFYRFAGGDTWEGAVPCMAVMVAIIFVLILVFEGPHAIRSRKSQPPRD